MTSLLLTSLLVVTVSTQIKMSASYSVLLNAQAELTLRVMPENYVLRVPSSEAVPEHIRLATQASDVVRQTVPHELNIRYGDRKQQLLDVYGTDLPPGSPIFVYIHGGGWYDGRYTKENSAYPVLPLWKAGIKVVVGEYDLAPNVTLGVIVEEIKELATFVLKMAKKENCRYLWFGGHSAGAHLVASLLQAEWYNRLSPDLKELIQGVVLISGSYDLKPLLLLAANDMFFNLDMKTAVELSPAFFKGFLTLPHPLTVFIVTAQQDSPVYHDQSLEYYEIIRKQPGINAVFQEVPGLSVDHFSNVINLQYSDYSLTKNITNLIKRSMI